MGPQAWDLRLPSTRGLQQFDGLADCIDHHFASFRPGLEEKQGCCDSKFVGMCGEIVERMCGCWCAFFKAHLDFQDESCFLSKWPLDAETTFGTNSGWVNFLAACRIHGSTTSSGMRPC